MAEAKMKDLELDIAELRSFLDKATRAKVKDIISVQVRKLETDLVQLKDAAKTTEAAGSKNTPKVTKDGPKVLECQIKDYCMYNNCA